jgi:molybdenum cofactor biosynthesis protein B
MSLEKHRRESPDMIRFAVLTFSDTRDAESDRGGAYLVERIEQAGHEVLLRSLHADEAEEIAAGVRSAVRTPGCDLVLTTGGTGIAPRDRTFTTLRSILDSEIPGFGELFRQLSFAEIGPAAMLGRAIGGLLVGKVVLALPGSPKALRLAMDAIVLPEAGHLVSQSMGT